MSSVKYTGKGTALIVRENCDSLKQFTVKTTITTTSDPYFVVINYENSIIGKQLLSGLLNPFNSSDGILASNTSFIFGFFLYEDSSGIIFLVTLITGIQKKCNYSSSDIQFYVPSVASKEVNDHFKLYVKDADEFNKLLKSNSNLNQLYFELKKKK